jgi:hypothetical protein
MVPLMPTPAKVNRAIKKAGFEDVTIYRGNGYYYFDDATTAIPSLYEWPKLVSTPEQIVDHVHTSLEKWRKQ